MSPAGRAIVVSGLGVVLSTACLYVADDVIFSSLATVTIIVVLVAMVSSLTVLPALLVTLGPRMDHPRIPLLRRRIDRAGAGRLWPAMLRPAMRNPGATLLVAADLTRLAQTDPAFGADVRGSIQSSGDGQVNVLTLAIPHEETSDQAVRTLETLRGYLPPSVSCPARSTRSRATLPAPPTTSTTRPAGLPWSSGWCCC